jgi:Ca2+-binding EF-hand superfamily protein
MSRKTLLIAAGVLVATGGLGVALAQIGPTDGRFSDRPSMRGWGDRPMMRAERDWGGPMRGGAFWRGRDRTLTQEQYDARTRERFARFDKNSDGVIDSAEIDAVLKDRGDRFGRLGEHFQKRLMARWDGNRDGKATKDEFLAGVKMRFAAFDLNNDGKITDDDLPPMMRGRNVLKGDDGQPPAFGPGARRRGGPMLGELRQADTNKDGIITLDEALARATARFETLDKSKDGSIDQADFDAVRNEMNAYRTQRFLHRFGADQDGKVTREQFYKVAKERFALRDLNNDGKLDREDLPPAMQGRRHLR